MTTNFYTQNVTPNGASQEVTLKRAQGQRVGTIRIDVTEDRVKTLKAGIFRTIAKDPESQFKFVAHFMTDHAGDYLTYDQACELLDDLSITEVAEISQAVDKAVQEAAAPKK